MPKGPNGQKRPADGIGCAVSVARIATGEDQDTGYVSRNRRKSGVAGAKARAKNLTAARRKEIAETAASVRWKMEEKMEQMTFDHRFQAAFDSGLADVKFFVRRSDAVTADDLKADALAFQEAIDFGQVAKVDGVD